MGAGMDNAIDSEQLNAAIYARLSLRNQEQTIGLREQISNCWDFCKMKEWKIRYVFIDKCKDGHATGNSDFYQIVKKARAENLDVIVFWKFDKSSDSKVDHVIIEKVSGTVRLRNSKVER